MISHSNDGMKGNFLCLFMYMEWSKNNSAFSLPSLNTTSKGFHLLSLALPFYSPCVIINFAPFPAAVGAAAAARECQAQTFLTRSRLTFKYLRKFSERLSSCSCAHSFRSKKGFMLILASRKLPPPPLLLQSDFILTSSRQQKRESARIFPAKVL
jgi:hypothetical protein